MMILIKNETNSDMQQAYREMLDGCLDAPESRIWHAVWFMELKDQPGVIVGDFSFKGLGADGMVEIGYGLREGFCGKGYMSEAVKAVSKWALSQEGVTRVEAETEENNDASAKVLLNAGFRPLGECRKEGPRYVYRGDGMLTYRRMGIKEAIKIAEIDASYDMKRVWKLDESGKYQLVTINWKNEMLPYGIQWHYEHFRNTILGGGHAYGCFDGNQLVGFATVNADMFGEKYKYVLLDQLFISNGRRNQGIGKKLFQMCRQAAKDLGAEKLYLCAWSAEDSMAFYRKNGCTAAFEINESLYAEDRNNIQLEVDVED